MFKILRSVLAVAAGYAVMVVLITLVQETWFGGVKFGESPTRVLVIAGFLTFVAAVIGGSTGSAIAGFRRAVPFVMGGMVVLETSVLIARGRVGGPLWFDILAAASLILGILLGGEAMRSYATRARTRTAS